MKRPLCIAVGIIATILLAGCEINITGQNDNDITTKVGADDSAKSELTVDVNDAGEDKETRQAPDSYLFEVISIPDEAKEKFQLSGFDEDLNSLWTFNGNENYVGQYEGIQDLGVHEDGYYINDGGILVCIDIYDGTAKWTYDGNIGTGCTWAFDEDDTLYITPYEGLHFVVIDKHGKTLYDYIKTDFNFGEYENTKGDFFWTYDLQIEENNCVSVHFDSNSSKVTFDLENLTVSSVEFPTIDATPLFNEWELDSWYDTGDMLIEDGVASIEFDQEMNASLYFQHGEFEANEFDSVPLTIENYPISSEDECFYGEWRLFGEYDGENSFLIGLSEENTLVVYWYGQYELGDEVIYTINTFTFKASK